MLLLFILYRLLLFHLLEPLPLLAFHYFSCLQEIKFLSFEKPNTAAQTWRIDVEINDKVVMILKENKIGDELRFGFYTGEVKFREAKKEKRKIEIIYLKEK